MPETPQPILSPPDRLLDIDEVLVLVPVSKATLWRLVRVGRFPRPKAIAPRRVAWLARDVARWVEGL